MGELIDLRQVSKSYWRGQRRFHVLREVSLALAPGEIAAVAGSRHEGKTTLLKVAAGLERPDSGEVLFCGRDLARCSDAELARLFADEIGWAATSSNDLCSNVLDRLALPVLMRARRGRRQARALATAALERVGAAECAEQRWNELSSWERVLVHLARATVSQPRLIVLDDLFDGFGLLRTQQAGEILLSLVGELGCSALLSTCELEPAGFADRVYCFDRGTVKTMTPASESEGTVIPFPEPQHARRSSGAGA
jgi:ABC-type lipoprotein export system ATPase subunit